MRALARAFVLAAPLFLVASGCVSVDTNLPASLPEYRYATPRAVVAAIDPGAARRVLGEALARARAPTNDPLQHTVGERRFSFHWTFSIPLQPDQVHEFDFAYDEVTPKIVDFRSLGGSFGVSLRKGGQDVPYAYFITATLADAETISDALAVLRAARVR